MAERRSVTTPSGRTVEWRWAAPTASQAAQLQAAWVTINYWWWWSSGWWGWWWGWWNWWGGWSWSSNAGFWTYYNDDGSSIFVWSTWVIRMTDKNWKTTETKVTGSQAQEFVNWLWGRWYSMTPSWGIWSWWWWTPNFTWLQFWQWTSDTDQASRNKELANYYAWLWNVSAEQIRKDLMKNAWFASASAQDQANTVDKILRMANANIVSWGWVNIAWMQFWQWTSDVDQKTRNEQLANYFAWQWDYSYDSIMEALKSNAAFANASPEDQAATVKRILNAANWISWWTNWMKFWADAYADTNYDIDSRNQTLANIINEREYDTPDKIYNWLENSSQAFKDASKTDKDLTVKKLMALSKYWVDSLDTEPDEEEIKEENKEEDEEIDEIQEDQDPYLQQLLDMIDGLQKQIDNMNDPYKDYYKNNPNEDTLNWAWDTATPEETQPLSMNSLSLAANLENNWTGAPEYVDPNLSTATPYLTPLSNIRQDVNNAWDRPVITEAWLVNNPVVPKFSVYNIDTPEWIIKAGNDALTNIMNWQYGWNTSQEAFQTYLLVQNRLRNYAAQNGIKEWTPEYMNLFRWVLDHPIRNTLAINQQWEWTETSQTE